MNSQSSPEHAANATTSNDAKNLPSPKLKAAYDTFSAVREQLDKQAESTPPDKIPSQLQQYQVLLELMYPKVLTPMMDLAKIEGSTITKVDETIVDSLHNVKGLWINAPGTSNSKKIFLFIHGGGFVLGSSNDYIGPLTQLSKKTGARVFAVEYRLAPEFQFPAGLQDCVNTYKWLLTQFSANRIIIIGDSAGGNLTITTTLACKFEGIPLPAGVCTIGGLMAKFGTFLSWKRNKHTDKLIGGITITDILYLGSMSKSLGESPLVYPVKARDDQLSGFPPTLLTASLNEVLIDENKFFADRLTRVGVQVETYYEASPCALHVLPMLVPDSPEADEFYTRLIKWSDLVVNE